MVSVDLFQDAVGKVIVAGKATLRAELKTDLQDFHSIIRKDMKKQMDELTRELHQKLQETSNQVGDTEERIKQIENNMAEMERWDIGVKDTLVHLLRSQRTLVDKVSDMEGQARRNNIRRYGVPEDLERGTSVTFLVENFLKTELGDILGQDYDFGTEHAHRASWISHVWEELREFQRTPEESNGGLVSTLREHTALFW